jgi:glycolate oxidase FAD binding subunit
MSSPTSIPPAMSTPITISPESSAEVQSAICAHDRLIVRGGWSKPALSATHEGAVVLDMGRLNGLIEYEPGEFTFTAHAGTPVRTIAAALAEHGQYLPFDPPLVEQGATLGGTVAAGVSGAGRHRYGGVRDFLIGVRFVDGQGRMVRGGGKVVKNAAGFDLPKLMVGSIGRLGVLTEVTFKVFPQPPQFSTTRAPQASIDAALATIARLNASTFDIEALDLVFEANAPVLYVRQGGLAATLEERAVALRSWLGAGEAFDAAADGAFWREAQSFGWVPDGWALIKTPVTLTTIPVLDQVLQAHKAQRRYMAGASQAWIAWPTGLGALDGFLHQLQLSGLLLRGQAATPFLGARSGASLAARVKRVLDPSNRFPTL